MICYKIDTDRITEMYRQFISCFRVLLICAFESWYFSYNIGPNVASDSLVNTNLVISKFYQQMCKNYQETVTSPFIRSGLALPSFSTTRKRIFLHTAKTSVNATKNHKKMFWTTLRSNMQNLRKTNISIT